jgi:hypothetical protein
MPLTRLWASLGPSLGLIGLFMAWSALGLLDCPWDALGHPSASHGPYAALRLPLGRLWASLGNSLGLSYAAHGPLQGNSWAALGLLLDFPWDALGHPSAAAAAAHGPARPGP